MTPSESVKPSGSTSADLAFFVALETEVWQALAEGDQASDGRLLTSDFVGVYPTGFADRSEHVGQLDSGPTIEAYELSDARLLRVGDDATMLSYRAVFTSASAAAGSAPETMYISSLWCWRGGRWRNIFSQDTVATG